MSIIAPVTLLRNGKVHSRSKAEGPSFYISTEAYSAMWWSELSQWQAITRFYDSWIQLIILSPSRTGSVWRLIVMKISHTCRWTFIILGSTRIPSPWKGNSNYLQSKTVINRCATCRTFCSYDGTSLLTITKLIYKIFPHLNFNQGLRRSGHVILQYWTSLGP